MIYTVTLNPALDRQLVVDEIKFNQVLRTQQVKVDVGGKGFNVSRMLAELGAASVALGFIAGHNGRILEKGLQELNIKTRFVSVHGETRTNISITTYNYSKYVKVNEPGAEVSDADAQALLKLIRDLAKPSDWWIISGSLPPGVPPVIYANIIEIVQKAKGYALLDASGDALKAGLAANPTVVKPNQEEAAELTGLTLNDEASLLKAVRMIKQMGAQSVLVSLGKAGALLYNNQSIWRARPPTIDARNPIGAGDSMVAGFVLQLSMGASSRQALRWSIACGAGTASQMGTTVGSRSLVENLLKQIIVKEIPDVIHS